MKSWLGFGVPIAWSDLGKQVAFADGKPASIWAWEKDGQHGGYAKALSSISEESLAYYGPDPGVVDMLRVYDEVNAGWIEQLLRRIEELRGHKAEFDEARANAQAAYERERSATTAELDKCLTSHANQLAALRRQAAEAPDERARGDLKRRADELERGIAEKTIVCRIGQDILPYKQWEIWLGERARKHRDLMATYDRGEAPAWFFGRSHTWKEILAQIAKLEKQLAEAALRRGSTGSASAHRPGAASSSWTSCAGASAARRAAASSPAEPGRRRPRVPLSRGRAALRCRRVRPGVRNGIRSGASPGGRRASGFRLAAARRR